MSNRCFALVKAGADNGGRRSMRRMLKGLISKQPTSDLERYYSQSLAVSLAENPENSLAVHEDVTSIELVIGRRSVPGSVSATGSATTLQVSDAMKTWRLAFDNHGFDKSIKAAVESVYGKIAQTDKAWEW